MASDNESATSQVLVSTTRAAHALGVSVSTIKRWVDNGVLSACRTPGGHRKVRAADLLKIAQQSEFPTKDLSLLGVEASAVPEETDRRLVRLSQRVYEGLLQGDKATVRTAVLGRFQGGWPLACLADQVIAPAMTRIGEQWEAGELDVFHEHRASEVLTAVLFEIKRQLESRASTDPPTAVGGAIDGDYHGQGSLLAQLVLLEQGWKAIDLGPSTPFASFHLAMDELKPKLMWISIGPSVDAGPHRDALNHLAGQAAEHGVSLVLGGQGADGVSAEQVSVKHQGVKLQQLAWLANQIYPPPCRPRLGRPPAQ